MSAALTVRLGSWNELSAQASPIRFTVFVDEQKVPVELELDEFDPLSCHALALAGDEAIGTGRLLP
ncbi:MAG: GNAT family N-acetyltransferase, partial [Zoogloea sp.]|nr:GNAT family N-acetyltransferase [Zoogloea sp.]